MTERRTAGLGACLGGGVAVWAAGAAIYGATEALTNTAVGLYQPLDTWGVVVLVYAVLGALGGAAAGLGLWLWRRLTPGRAAAPLMAMLPAMLLGVQLALPLNDRFLGRLLSPTSLAANLVLTIGCMAVGMVIQRRLAEAAGVRLLMRFANVALWLSVLLSAGNYLDVFFTGRVGVPWTLAAFVVLLVACLALYALTDRLLGVSARAARWRVAPAAGVLVLVAAGAVGAPALMGAAATGEGGARPNVLWIVMDTTRADHLSAYGYPRPTTPHVDALAAEGVLFENAMAQASWTLSSHFQMVTSRFAAGKAKILDPSFLTAAEMLHAGGYRTGAVLANFSLGRRSGFEQGFETFIDGPVQIFYLKAFEKIPVVKALLRSDVLPPELVLRFLQRRAFLEGEAARGDAISSRALDWMTAGDGRPFFMFVNYMDPHDAYDPPAPFRARFAADTDPELGFVHYSRRLGGEISSNRFVRDVLPTMSAADLHRLVDLYDGEVAYMDEQIGRLVAGLKARGLYERTIVVVTADHGELFGEHGLASHFKSLSEEELHVPLIMRFPPALPAARRVKSLVELTDVLPTLLELLGTAPPQPMDGTSLLPLVRDPEEAAARGEAFSFLVRPADKKYDFTLAGNLVGRRAPDTKYVWSETGRHAYYDLIEDPKAERNLYGEDPQSPAVRGVEERVIAWRKQVDLERLDTEAAMDRLTRDRLRALGYVQ